MMMKQKMRHTHPPPNLQMRRGVENGEVYRGKEGRIWGKDYAEKLRGKGDG